MSVPGKSNSGWLTILKALFLLAVVAYLAYHAVYLTPFVSSLLGRNQCGIRRSYSAIPDANKVEGAKLRARSRLIKEADGLELWQTPLGEFWNPRGNDLFYTLAEQWVRNYGDGPYRVKPGNIVLDCGANVGDFVREALSAGAKLVIAIEPVPRSAECVRRTFAPEIAAGRVRLVEKAVWHEAGTMKMYLHDNALLDTLMQRHEAPVAQVVEVPLITIDTLVAELGLPRVDFIKMDIEGAEPNALRGARGTIQTFRPQISIATEHSPGEYAEVTKIILAAAPYRPTCGRCTKENLDFFPEVTFYTPQ